MGEKDRPAPPVKDGGGAESADSQKPSRPQESFGNSDKRAERVRRSLRAALNDCHLFHDEYGRAYASVPGKRGRETYPIGSPTFKEHLARVANRATEEYPEDRVLKWGVDQARAKANLDGPTEAVHIRTGSSGEKVYVDLANDEREIVEIDSDGWRVKTECPLNFYRPKTMRPLPLPARGGNLEELRRFVNVGSEDDWVLLVSWLVGSMNPRGAYPILFLHGPQDAAKTTVAKVLKNLLDPASTETRSDPKDQEAMLIGAQESRVLVFDNVSNISRPISDALCRLAYGQTLTKRKLYEDGEEYVLHGKCPVIVTGIPRLTIWDDLISRSVILGLPGLSDSTRLTEEEFWDDFRVAHPRLLGALFDVVSRALRNKEKTRPTGLPRMADFVVWVLAAEPALPWPPGTFEWAYQESKDADAGRTVDTDPLLAGVRDIALRSPDWQGSWETLRAEILAGKHRERDLDLPNSARAIYDALVRGQAALRKVGVEYKIEIADTRMKRKIIRLRLLPQRNGQRRQFGE